MAGTGIVQHNITAMSSYRNYSNNYKALAKNLEKLSSGYKINRAGDDAAGLAISEKMRAQIAGLQVASKNAKDGISLVQTAEGALTEVHDMLRRMVTLAEQSANGTYDATDRDQLQKEVNQLRDEINRIADSANFNGIKLLDGSMDATIKTTLNKVDEAFGIADWVGSNELNASSAVGEGTIWHTDPKDATGTSFAVELNNSTVASKDGVKISLGGVTLELTGEEIAQGASAEDIVNAIVAKYGEGGTEEVFFGADENGEGGVKFDITAGSNGTSIIFTQSEPPKTEAEVIDGNMKVTYEGIGGGVASETTTRLNITKPDAKLEGTGTNKAYGTAAIIWGATGATAKPTDEQKDALNKILDNGGNGIKIKATVKYDGEATGTAVEAASVDLSELLEKLGDGYEVVVKDTTGSEVEADAKNVYKTESTNNKFVVTIKDAESADVIAEITIDALALDDGNGAAGTPAANDANTYTANVTLSAGNNQKMNNAPDISVEDGGNMQKSGTTMLVLETLDDDKRNALNEAIGKDGATITLHYTDLSEGKTTTSSKLWAELSDSLKDAGYYLATDTTNPDQNVYDEETGLTAKGHNTNDDVLYLYDKDNNKIATITANGKERTDITRNNTVISLTQSSFNSEDAVTGGIDEKKVAVGFKAGAIEDGDPESTMKGVNWSDNSTSQQINDGDEFTFNINGKNYTVTAVAGGGLTEDEKNSGEVLDISALGDKKATTILAAIRTALQKQLDNEAAEAAKGTEDYVKIDISGANTTFAANADDPSRIDIKATTQKFFYVGDQAADDGDDGDGSGAVNGGKDPNASTVEIESGSTASDGRLASTFLTASDFAGLKDGSQLKVGDTVYTFAVGKDSKFKDAANLIDLTHMTADDANLLKEALDALSRQKNDMFSIGHDEPDRVTFTEWKDYQANGGTADLTTQEGIAEQFGFYADGMESTSSGHSLTLQIGDTAEDYNQLKVNIQDCHTTALGIDDIDITDQDNAIAAVDSIRNAINYVSDVRGTLGATQNRLEHTINNLSVMTENIQDAESTIRDTDIAEEMMAYTKNNILVQAAQAMLAQANMLPQGVLQLLG